MHRRTCAPVEEEGTPDAIAPPAQRWREGAIIPMSQDTAMHHPAAEMCHTRIAVHHRSGGGREGSHPCRRTPQCTTPRQRYVTPGPRAPPYCLRMGTNAIAHHGVPHIEGATLAAQRSAAGVSLEGKRLHSGSAVQGQRARGGGNARVGAAAQCRWGLMIPPARGK